MSDSYTVNHFCTVLTSCYKLLIFRAAVERLHCVDDAFRRQLESLQASHQAELLRLANDKQKQIELANQRVLQARTCFSTRK